MKISWLFVVLCLLILPVSACGIKPGSVDAPPSVEQDNFPRQYPAPQE